MANRLIGTFDPQLSQVLDLQEKLQRQPHQAKHTITCNSNLYEYIVNNDQLLIDNTTLYTITNNAIEERFDNDWFAFMNFARKNRSWLNDIESCTV